MDWEGCGAFASHVCRTRDARRNRERVEPPPNSFIAGFSEKIWMHAGRVCEPAARAARLRGDGARMAGTGSVGTGSRVCGPKPHGAGVPILRRPEPGAISGISA